MKLRYLIVLTTLASSPAASAADTSDRSSPLDNNPACMDRSTDSSTGNCVVPGEGKPRHTFPPRSSPSAVAPAPAPAPIPVSAEPTMRKSAASSGGK